jgi:hypothetical protein
MARAPLPDPSREFGTPLQARDQKLPRTISWRSQRRSSSYSPSSLRVRTPGNRTHSELQPPHVLRSIPSASAPKRPATPPRALATPHALSLLLLLSPTPDIVDIGSDGQCPSRWSPAAAEPTLGGPGARSAPAVHCRTRHGAPQINGAELLQILAADVLVGPVFPFEGPVLFVVTEVARGIERIDDGLR